MKKIKRKIYNISKKTGDRFGFDLPYFVENGFWVLLSQFVNMVASFAMSVIFARYLSKEVFGEYQLVISIVGVLAIISYSGLNVSILRSVARGFDYSYINAVKFSFKKSLIAIPVFVGIAIWYYFQEKLEMSGAFLISGLFFSFIYSQNKWVSFWRAKEKFASIAKMQIIQSLSLNIILILTAYFFTDNLFIITFFYLLTNTFFNTVWHFITKKQITNNKIDEKCIPYGKYITNLGVLSSLILYFDKIVIGFFNIKFLAVYTIALKLFNITKQLLKSFYSVSLPKFAKKNIKVSSLTILLLLFTGLVVSVFLYSFAGTIIHFFYTGKYDDSINIFKKIIFALPFLFVNPLLVNKISTQKIKKKIVFVKIYTPIISMGLSILIFALTLNTEYFIITKMYSYHILNFIFLVPWFFKD